MIRCNDLFVFDGFVSLPGEKADAAFDWFEFLHINYIKEIGILI